MSNSLFLQGFRPSGLLLFFLLPPGSSGNTGKHKARFISVDVSSSGFVLGQTSYSVTTEVLHMECWWWLRTANEPFVGETASSSRGFVAQNPNTSSSQVTCSALSSCPSPAELAAWRGADVHDGAGKLTACTSTPHPNVRPPLNPKGRSFPQSTLSLEMWPQHNIHAPPLRQVLQLEDDQCESPRRGWGGCDYWPEMEPVHTAGGVSTKISSTGVSTSGQKMLLQVWKMIMGKKNLKTKGNWSSQRKSC